MKTKKTGVPVYVLCSRQSARQFIRLYAGVQPTAYWFHQTLTFGTPKPDLRLAHARLKTLLDRLEKTHPDMACFWVREQEKVKGYHFHVIFLFFGSQPLEPEAMRQKFGAVVYAHWNAINGGGLFRNASLMTLREKDNRCIEYLTKGVKICPKTKRSVLWHGQRNGRLIRANSCPAPKSEVKRLLKICFDDRNPPDKPASELTPVYFGKRELRELKAYVDFDGEGGWEDFKRRRTGRNGKVSDDDLMEFINAERGTKEPPSKRHPPFISFPKPANWTPDPDDVL
jgi:hypothetical protein